LKKHKQNSQAIRAYSHSIKLNISAAKSKNKLTNFFFTKTLKLKNFETTQQYFSVALGLLLRFYMESSLNSSQAGDTSV